MLTNRGPALALAALFVISVYGVSLSSKPHQNNHTIAKGNGSAKNCSPHISVPESAEERIADYTWWLSCFTLALVVVSTFQMSFLIRADKTARIAANAAKQSADSLRNIERAYVLIDYELLRERNIALREGEIRNKQIALVFKNFGRTPAIVNGGNRKCRYWPKRNLPNSGTDSIKIPSGVVIGSGSPWSIPASFEGSYRDLDDARNGAGSIYLYGKIAYLDMFGEQRETGFCCGWNFAKGQFFMAPNTKLNYYK